MKSPEWKDLNSWRIKNLSSGYLTSDPIRESAHSRCRSINLLQIEGREWIAAKISMNKNFKVYIFPKWVIEFEFCRKFEEKSSFKTPFLTLWVCLKVRFIHGDKASRPSIAERLAGLGGEVRVGGRHSHLFAARHRPLLPLPEVTVWINARCPKRSFSTPCPMNLKRVCTKLQQNKVIKYMK